MSNFYPLEVVDRGSETQLQGVNILNNGIRFKTTKSEEKTDEVKLPR